jgi:protein SCO1
VVGIMLRQNAIRIEAVAVLLLAGLALVSSKSLSAASGRWGADYFPNVPLITQDGQTVRFYDDLLKDKIVAIDLIYTRCQFECPLETARMAQVQRTKERHAAFGRIAELDDSAPAASRHAR